MKTMFHGGMASWNILHNMEELKKIEEIRTRFFYDFEGNTRCILCDVGDIIT